MIDHFRSDLFDDVVKRHLKTIDILVDKEKPLGPIHKYLIDNTFKNVRSDVSKLNIRLKAYKKFSKLKLKYQYKLDKCSFRKKERRFLKLLKIYNYKALKFKIIIPSEFLSLNSVNEDINVKPVTVSEVLTEIAKKKEEAKLDVPALNSAKGKPKEEKKDKDVNSEIPPGQISIELHKFFNGVTLTSQDVKA